MIVISLLVFLIITAIVKYVLHMRNLDSYVKHLQTRPNYYPFFGNSLELIGRPAVEIFNDLIDFVKTHTTPIKVYMGPFLMVIIDKPEDIKTILMSPNCQDKPYYYQFYSRKTSILSATCEFSAFVNIFYAKKSFLEYKHL